MTMFIKLLQLQRLSIFPPRLACSSPLLEADALRRVLSWPSVASNEARALRIYNYSYCYSYYYYHYYHY